LTKIKTGIVGCGKVAPIHAAALCNIPESIFTGVCSRTIEKAQGFARQYGVQAFKDVKTMIEKGGVEAIIIGSPHPEHAGAAILAAQAGVHVLIEKPLASSLQDCDAMLKAKDQAGIKLGMISQRRLYAPVQRVKNAIESGKIGRPIIGTVTMLGWRDQAYYNSDPWRGSWKKEGGGVLVNQAPHQLDILQWFMGPIEELYGSWANLNHNYVEVEDTAMALIRYKNGALGNILVSNSQNPALYGKVHVHGANGATVGVKTDGGAMFIAGMSSIAEPPVNDIWTVPGEIDLLPFWQKKDAEFFSSIDATKYYHQLQMQDFLQAIIQDRQPMVPGEEGRKTVEIFTAIYRSQRDKKPIKFPLQPEMDRNDYDGRLSLKGLEKWN
jgi:UDP-N-acetyl-2-amino-2-deoxyglucuronate dehydrogenase